MFRASSPRGEVQKSVKIREVPDRNFFTPDIFQILLVVRANLFIRIIIEDEDEAFQIRTALFNLALRIGEGGERIRVDSTVAKVLLVFDGKVRGIEKILGIRRIVVARTEVFSIFRIIFVREVVFREGRVVLTVVNGKHIEVPFLLVSVVEEDGRTL